MIVPEANVDQLIQDLNKQTQPSQAKVEVDETPVIELTEVKEEQRKSEPAPKPVEDISPDKARGMAARWVKTFSSGLKVLLSWTYKKTILKPGDEKAMEEFVRAHKGQSEKEMQEAITSDSPMYDVSNRFDKYLKACEEIPLDQDEMDSIAEPLQELIIKHKNLQLTPEWMLVISVVLVMLPRLTHLMPDLSKLFAAKK